VVALAQHRVDVLQPLFTQLAAIDEELIPLLSGGGTPRSDELSDLRLSIHHRIAKLIQEAQENGVTPKEIAASLGVHAEVLRPWMHPV
jgi:hypothetical protein